MSKVLKPGRHDQTSIFGLPLPTKQRHTSYQHSSANLPTPLRQQGSYRALRHSPTKETQAPTSEQKPKPFLSLSAVRKVRPGKHEGGLRLRGQLRGLRDDYRQYARLPTCTTHENPSEQNPKSPLSIGARQDEGSDLSSARGDALASRSKPTSTPTYRNPTSAPSNNLPTLLRRQSSYRYASYQHSYRLPARPTATDQHSEGSGSADEGLDLGRRLMDQSTPTTRSQHSYASLPTI